MLSFVISNDEKVIYLERLRGRVWKMLPLFVDKFDEKYSYEYKIYLSGLLININTANKLFGGTLIDVFVNLSCLYDNDFVKEEIRTRILEIPPMINKIIDEVNCSG